MGIRISICLLLLFFFCESKAQTVLNPDSVLAKISDEYPAEKIYLQTDKTYYTSGETIWGKLWCVADAEPTYLSSIAYVLLVNTQGVVVAKKMHRLDSISSAGFSLDIDNNLEEGNYTIVAHTLWMLNDPSFVFKKQIFVYNPLKRNGKKATIPQEISLSFFPEGGDMLAGVDNKVAFKANDANGFSLAINGFIADKSGVRIADFKTEHEGMGVIVLKNVDTVEYVANVVLNNGAVQQFKLPKAKQDGIGFTVDNTNPNRLVVILKRPENAKASGIVKLVAHMNHQIVFSRNMNIDEGEVAAPINKKKLPAGIIHITLFNELNLPLAERLAFVDNLAYAAPIINEKVINAKSRTYNKLQFTIPDVVKSSLSVRITDALLDAASTDENNILSGLLLTSDLKGYVNNPGYYFVNKNDTVKKHLDMLLMTQGWRRFVWNQVLKNDFPKLKYPVETGLSLKGKVTKSGRKDPITDGSISFIIRGEDSTNIISEAKLTDRGEFIVDGFSFKKQAEVAYQGTNNKKDKLIVDVEIYPSYIDSLKRLFVNEPLNLDSVDIANAKSLLANYLKDLLAKSDTTGQSYLGTVTVSAKKLSQKDSLNLAYATGPFQMGQTINPNEFKNYTTIWQILQAAIPGLRVGGDFINPTVSFGRYEGIDAVSQSSAGSSQAEFGGTTFNGMLDENNGIAYFLNEINVSKDIIATLDVNDIALIKSMKLEASILGASQGAIAVYTKKGFYVGNKPYEKTFTTMTKAGYAITRAFFNPDYSTNPNLNNTVKDNRYTLFWSSNINPQTDGNFAVGFYNNDFATAFKVIIQGIDKSGKLIYGEYILK
jgi:hypothetical protein